MKPSLRGFMDTPQVGGLYLDYACLAYYVRAQKGFTLLCCPEMR